MLNKNNTLSLSFILILFSMFLLFNSCKGDDPVLPPSSYDPAKTIYGTRTLDRTENTECIIDIETGQFTVIPQTVEQNANLNPPFGTKQLTDFAGNKRIYVDGVNQNLIVQDLSTFESTSIEVIDPETNIKNTAIKFLNFGATKNEIFALSAQRRV